MTIDGESPQRAVLTGPRRWELEQFSLRDPGPGEVVLDLRGRGVFIGHDDLARWGSARGEYPVFGGQDGGGQVCELGAGVTNVQIGDVVAVLSPGGVGMFATHAVVDVRRCRRVTAGVEAGLMGQLARAQAGWWEALAQFQIPKGCSPERATHILGEGTVRAPSVAIVGSGTLAQGYALAAAGEKAHVIAVGWRQEGLHAMRALGAQETFNSCHLAATAIREAIRAVTSGLGADIVIETRGDGLALLTAGELLAQCGVLVVAAQHRGPHGGRRSIPWGTWGAAGYKIVNAHGCEPASLLEALAYVAGRAADGDIDPAPPIMDSYPLAEINEAFVTFEAGWGEVKLIA